MEDSKEKNLTLDELYHKMLKRAAEGKNVEDIDNADPKMIECLAHPEETSLGVAGEALHLFGRQAGGLCEGLPVGCHASQC